MGWPHLAATADEGGTYVNPRLGEIGVVDGGQVDTRPEAIDSRTDVIKVVRNACESIGVGPDWKPCGRERW